MSVDELGLLLQFLNVNVAWPYKAREDPNNSPKMTNIPSLFPYILLINIREENVHHDGKNDHSHRNVNERMIQTSH